MPTPEKKDVVNKEALTAVNAALETLAASERVDEGALKSISDTIDGLNEKTQQAILNLPAMQTLLEKYQEKQSGEPGSYRKVGLFDVKIPYTQADLYRVWGTVEKWVCPAKETVVTPGGWVFKLTEGVVYDIPRGTPAAEIPENHGYQLPGIVVQIFEQSREDRRVARKETENANGFGLGVRFLETGWAGKDSVVAEGVGNAPVDPAD